MAAHTELGSGSARGFFLLDGSFPFCCCCMLVQEELILITYYGSGRQMMHIGLLFNLIRCNQLLPEENLVSKHSPRVQLNLSINGVALDKKDVYKKTDIMKTKEPSR
ncbi:hypothetical protein ATANTOWER_020506 [Ataeniobius toweri]|uniref:Uncharacterized protein n=1 Tax=Ataeniobius toweri TaxID=208326 RepID=A0ABU7AJP7_9TELE|nr:hypothetical protein [Ataeniobius toweri]